MTIKLAIVSIASASAVAPVVDDMIETAGKVGTMGMQSLLVLMLLMLGFVIWYQEKHRKTERESRDKEHKAQYDNLLRHHETFAGKSEEERASFHLEMKAHAAELRGLTERSIVAMHATATAVDTLRVCVYGPDYRGGLVDRKRLQDES